MALNLLNNGNNDLLEVSFSSLIDAVVTAVQMDLVEGNGEDNALFASAVGFLRMLAVNDDRCVCLASYSTTFFLLCILLYRQILSYTTCIPFLFIKLIIYTSRLLEICTRCNLRFLVDLVKVAMASAEDNTIIDCLEIMARSLHDKDCRSILLVDERNESDTDSALLETQSVLLSNLLHTTPDISQKACEILSLLHGSEGCEEHQSFYDSLEPSTTMPPNQWEEGAVHEHDSLDALERYTGSGGGGDDGDDPEGGTSAPGRESEHEVVVVYPSYSSGSDEDSGSYSSCPAAGDKATKVLDDVTDRGSTTFLSTVKDLSSLSECEMLQRMLAESMRGCFTRLVSSGADGVSNEERTIDGDTLRQFLLCGCQYAEPTSTSVMKPLSRRSYRTLLRLVGKHPKRAFNFQAFCGALVLVGKEQYHDQSPLDGVALLSRTLQEYLDPSNTPARDGLLQMRESDLHQVRESSASLAKDRKSVLEIPIFSVYPPFVWYICHAAHCG